MGVLSVLAAVVAAFAAASAWYMGLSRRWVAAVGRGDAELREAGRRNRAFVIAPLGYLLTAGMMRHVLDSGGVAGIGAGLTAGLGLGLFVAAPFVVTNYAFADRPRDLWWIDAGHVVLVSAVIGAVLGAFG